MQYEIQYKINHYEILDEYGRFIESADTYKEAEASKKELELKEDMKGGDSVSSDIIWSVSDVTYTFVISALVAKARWIHRSGKAIKVPCGEFHRELLYVKAFSEEEAIKKANYSNDNLVRDVMVIDALDENQG